MSNPVFENSVAIVLSFSRLGTARKVKKSQVAEKSEGIAADVVVDADTDMVHVGRDIIDSDELRAIASFDGAVRLWIEARCLPSSLFKAGVKCIPVSLLEDVYAYLEAAKVQREKLIDAFIESYPAKVEEARDRLKGLFDARHYPAVTILKRAFEMKWNIVSFDTPGKLKAISASLYEKERAKVEAEWAGAAEQVRNALRVGMVDLVEHMIERLSSDSDGKAKVFRNTLVENFNEFATLFAARNLTNDTELAALVEKAQKVMSGVDAKSLRSDADIKERVSQGFAEIKANLDTMVVNRPARAITLADENV
jgi:hypothetical protein